MIIFSICFCFTKWRRFRLDGALLDERVGGHVCVEFIDASHSVIDGDVLCR